MDIKTNLIKKLKSKEAKIGVFGLGYVGLPLAMAYAKSGYTVLGFDIDQFKAESINSGNSYIYHICSSELNEYSSKKKIQATTDFERVSEVDAIIICVPTPLSNHREPDLSFIRATMKSILPNIHSGQVISLESTTYPGTTSEEILPLIIKKGFEIGKDFFLVYSPEREDPGNKNFETSTIPKVLGGDTESCRAVGLSLYEQAIDKVVPVSSTRVAEMTKLLENIYRSVNIGLMNELKVLTNKMEIDLYEVIDAAKTKPFGFLPFYPGPGLGGHCIPIDPFYLTWKAREYGMHTRFIELAGEINTSMPNYVVEKTVSALNQACKSIKGSRILVLGIAYKKNTGDIRESPAVEILNILNSKGASISYSDPFFPVFPQIRKSSFNLRSIELNAKSLKKFDATILTTDHDSFDYKLIKDNSSIIIDSRGRFDLSENVYRA